MRVLSLWILLVSAGGLLAETGPPREESPPWFALKLRVETAEELFLDFIKNPAHLTRDCHYGGKARIRELFSLEGRTFARIEYRLLCLEIGSHPDPFPRRRLYGPDFEQRILAITEIYRPRTRTDLFEYRWDGKAWKIGGKVNEDEEARIREGTGGNPEGERRDPPEAE